MKKLFAGLLAAVLMSASLVAATSTAPASAACGDPQYPACFETETGLRISRVDGSPRKRKLTASVRATGTNADPTGRFLFRVQRRGASNSAVFIARAVPPSGVVSVTRKFSKGRYTARVFYRPRDNSIFQPSRSPIRGFRIR